MKRFPVLGVMFVAAVVSAQSVKTHEVHPDGTVTFRYIAPNAVKVELTIDTIYKPMAMTKEDNGVWQLTTPVMPPEVYNYGFIVDGAHNPDPHNTEVHPGYGNVESLLTVPGATPMPWELQAVPHGELTMHRFTSKIATNLHADQSSYVVYTPARYDAKKKGGYPVLYLLHGYGDGDEAWTQVGRAHLVMDSLIAAGKAVPMIVVMPTGYGDFSFLTKGYSQWKDEAAVDQNVSLFTDSLEKEVMPAVEKEYNCAKGRENRAIAGLSMGGLETLSVGLNHPEQFAYVAGMSSAIHLEKFDAHYPAIVSAESAKKANFKLLWVGVGADDGLLAPNRDFVTWAKAKGFNVQAVETPGAHQWTVWRENLVTVAPMLFR